MPTYLDQMGRKVPLNASPQRIISLVPSQTELLLDLGLGSRVIGRTKFCIHPADKVQNIPIIGGTKTFNLESIADLEPDLIIGNKEENYSEGIETLEKKYPVWMSDIYTLNQVFEMIKFLGRICHCRVSARGIILDIQNNFQNFDQWLNSQTLTLPRIAYLIWRKPYMVVGKDTFIHEMIQNAGFENVFANQSRYPEVQLEEITALKPDFIFLSSEPFPFDREKYQKEMREHFPKIPIHVVDGELFSWYGSRISLSPPYFKKLWESILAGGNYTSKR